MNKIGTVRYENAMNEYSKKLDEKGITGNQTMYTEFGSSVNPVGLKQVICICLDFLVR